MLGPTYQDQCWHMAPVESKKSQKRSVQRDAGHSGLVKASVAAPHVLSRAKPAFSEGLSLSRMWLVYVAASGAASGYTSRVDGRPAAISPHSAVLCAISSLQFDRAPN